MKFIVKDNKTGFSPDVEQIVLNEDWAKNMIYRDCDAFAITENGNLILLDECGHYAVCPRDRFTIIPRMVDTGVCDKNGTRIKEGDIVEFDGERYCIAYNEGEFVLTNKGRMIDYRLKECYPFVEVIKYL